MPKLPTYTAQVGPVGINPGRRATAEDFGGGEGLVEAGRSVRNAAGVYLAEREDDEARQALVKSSQVRAKYARALDDAATNGGDLEALKGQMADEMAAIGDGFQTKRGTQAVELYSANGELMFDEQANRINVQRAASNAKLGYGEVVRNAGAIMQNNPGYLAVAERDVDTYIDTYQGRLSPEQRAGMKDEARKELNVGAAAASARMDPKGTKAKLQAGEWNLTPAQREGLISHAETEIRGQQAEEDRARVQARIQREEDSNKAQDKYTKLILSGKGIREAASDPTLTAVDRQNVFHFQEWRTRELQAGAEVGNKQLEMALFKRILAPDGTPDKLYSATEIYNNIAPGKLNTTQAAKLMSYVAASKDENGRTFGARVASSLGVVQGAMRASAEWGAQPELAAAVQLQLRDQAEKRADQLRKDGQNPDAILDPASKDYFFTPGRLKQVADQVKAQANDALQSSLPKPKTAAEYDAIPPGTAFVDDDGKTKTKPKAVAPAVSTLDRWRAATGGKLKPGQTQAQAVAEWEGK